jgi:hypothetical protein
VARLYLCAAVGGRVDQRFDAEMRQVDPGKVIPKLLLDNGQIMLVVWEVVGEVLSPLLMNHSHYSVT